MNRKTLIARAWLIATLVSLAACGGGSGDSAETPPPQVSACDNTDGAINSLALETENCDSLASYRLFQDPANPTTAANGTGLPYDLNTPLFTDYASKYRFVFVPEGKQAAYTENESFDFPVGTVIAKTFALPDDTAFRGFENETLIETRLLIRRDTGWTALPYVWNSEGTRATLAIAGQSSQRQLIHNGNTLGPFTYNVPDTNQCKQCHQLKEDSTSSISRFEPIGPKARHLNRDFDYGTEGVRNQLVYWQEVGILSGLPSDISSVPQTPAYQDTDMQNLDSKSVAEIQDLAKGYLDINCAHCHRPEGGASNTGLNLEYWRDFEANQFAHGVCKRPVAYGGGALSFDIDPGNSQESIIHYRISSTQPGDRMPEIGRALVHNEGVTLIAAWIDNMTGSCTTP
ncbi:hypothetical protein D777_01484 [Marinobacter nitratireducens]|uniref:Cytochrome c domain-containing protein n=1 Tax=Marinobacter nitratireducens TaxID=1137280 RepID=A0A072N490_9GAMM|nr:SO2930 family diheme c-type cytochrome [Marinobacter nitratireducens]KEF31798.1 hypothetical protein D777_01484 [Marinobacter nitratireducens]